ncbi:MAG: hypothetical protein ABSA03_16095 [Streptosporangiaceae bacterium]
MLRAPFFRRCSLKVTLSALFAVCCTVFLLAPVAAAAPAQVPTITDLGASTTYYDGVQLNGTLTSNGDSVLYTVMYGPTGGTSTTPMAWNQPSGTGANVPVSVTLGQLTPNTGYSYTWQVWDQNTGNTTTGPSGTFTTGALPSGPATPIVPPANPTSNGIYNNCGSDTECLADINGIRAAQENLPPIVPPTNWNTLTGAEQIFVFTNLERVSRGLAAIPNLVNLYDSQLQTGIATDDDPNLPVPSLGIWAGPWATPMAAFLGWEYYDGPGGSNLDCTPTMQAGCWGHRDAILDATVNGSPVNEMDAATGPDNNGQTGYDAAFYNDPGTPPPANVVMTWASEQQYLTGTPPPSIGTDIVSTENCATCTPPLTYHGGPVMGTAQTTGAVTVTPIFWTPAGFNAPTATYQSLIDRFLTDVSAASGTNTNVFSVGTEYGGLVNGQMSNINYQISYSGDQVDTDPFPANSCTPTAGYTACVADPQITAELSAYLAANNLPEDQSHFYPVFFPAGVETTNGQGWTSMVNYCAYHSYFQGTAGTVIYANEPAPTMTGCNVGESPNNDVVADAEISVLSHELMESITDPLVNAWTDSMNNEIGDECAWTFGTPLGSTNAASPNTSQYNQVINGNDYYIQEMFSNADYATGPMRGCVQSESQVGQGAMRGSARQGGYESPDAITVTSADQALSGKQTSTVLVHVDSAAGAPVAGDHIVLDITGDTEDESAVCGRLSADEGDTNSAGDLSVTYTAATMSAECTIIAVESDTGQHGLTTLYLGGLKHICPKITFSGASKITAGKAAQLSAAIYNPADEIDDVITGITISGDDGAHTGISAGQVRLFYRVGNKGAWRPIVLAGKTGASGSITGEPADAPTTFPAKSTENLEFRITVSKSAPDKTLTFGLSLNQTNTASGSTDEMYGNSESLPVVR